MQNADVDEKNEEEGTKPDVNWYSSDEEETPEPVQESTSSPLATLLRTIQTSSSSSNNVPNSKKEIDDSIPVSTHLFAIPPTADNECVPVSISVLSTCKCLKRS